jgi:predicted RNase H-related nuclease YkuK (DUF458 family)
MKQRKHSNRGIQNFDMWFSPSKNGIYSFSHIVDTINSHSDCEIHIGTDSHLKKGDTSKHVFATVVCIQKVGSGAFYYYMFEDVPNNFNTLSERILEEAARSIEIVEKLRNILEDRRVTVHSDTNTNHIYPTTKLTEIIHKWVKSMGADFLAKPDAWASTCVADMHSKENR